MKVKLGDLTKIRTGKLDANAASENGKYPFFTCSKEPLRISTYSYDCECVLVAGNGDLNAKYYNGKFDAYQRTYIIESNSDRRLYLPYLYYFMTRYIQDLRRLSIGGVIKYIKLGNLTDAEISLPDIEKQKVACKKLEKVKNIIDKKESQLFYLDNLIKARFVEMFGTCEKWNDANWKITSIDEIIEKPKSGEWGQKDESGRGIGVIRTTNFSDRGAVYFNSITTRDIPREKLITKGIKNGDILIEKSGGSDKKPVGRVVLYTGESNKYLNNNFTAILRINNNTEVNNIFLFTFLYINYWQGGTKVFESKTTGIHNLNLKEFLNKTKIAIPDMLLQNQFATFVAQIDKSKFALSNELAMGNFYIRLIHDCIMHGCIDL